jgi:hypothetical protein
LSSNGELYGDGFMSIEVTRVEPKLYLNVATGFAKLEDVAGAVQEMARMATELGDPFYVIVSDATEVRNIPFDLKNLRHLAERDHKIAAILIVNPPYIAKISATTLEVHATRESALQRAHDVLAKRAQAEQEKSKS